MNREQVVSGEVQRETLVRVKEAAKVVGMGVGSLYRLCKIGAVRSYKGGPKTFRGQGFYSGIDGGPAAASHEGG